MVPNLRHELRDCRALFTVRTITIGELLSGAATYRVPTFQRAYAWDEDLAAQLLDDITAAITEADTPADEPYFLGALITVRNEKGVPSDIVDGQQRLVTLSTILSVIRDALPNQSERDRLDDWLWCPEHPFSNGSAQARVQIRPIDQDRFESAILRPGATQRLPRHGETDAEHRLIAAATRIRSDLLPSSPDYLRHVAKRILDQTTGILIETDTIDNAYKLFRSVNTRGQPLSALDIVRAELLGIGDAESREVARVWGIVEDSIGEEQLSEYVEIIISSILPDSRRDVGDRFRQIMGAAQLRVPLVRRMNDFLHAYISLDTNGAGLPDVPRETQRIISCVRALPFEEWWPAALAFLARSPTSGSINKFFRALDAVGLMMILTRMSKSKRAKRFGEAVSMLGNSKDRTEAGGPLSLNRNERLQAIDAIEGQLKVRGKELGALLLRLNAAMATPELPPHFPSEITVEHILPRKPRGEWLTDFPSEKDREDMTNMLGNLAILSRRINSSAKNLPFDEKKQKIFGIDNNNSFPITSHICSFKSWGIKDIRDRHEQLVGIVRGILNSA